jgi:acetyl-CoA synthetase
VKLGYWPCWVTSVIAAYCVVMAIIFGAGRFSLDAPFAGRDDDLITRAGSRIGPAEVESCVSRHTAVATAAVVRVPDPIRTEVIKAVIVLAGRFEPTTQLAANIRNFVRTRLAAHEYPRTRIIEFDAQLPLTASGKVIRRLLRSW